MMTSLFLVAVLAGGIAAVAGFGIGSLLTPLLSISLGTSIAVAVVSVPHFIATAFRFWMLKGHVDKGILLRFGITSAVGGLAGALLHVQISNRILTLIFAGILLFVGTLGLLQLSEKMRFSGAIAWIAGAVSGALGGLVGNQGGIRSAALMGFGISKEAFVATATATGLIVDAVRMPVYFVTQWKSIADLGNIIVIGIAGVLVGTWIGVRFLRRLPERKFKQIVSALLFMLGLFMLFQ